MNSRHIVVLSLFLLMSLSVVLGSIPMDTPVKRFEYKYSFKPPYLAQKDGTVPFFEHSGNAIASEENLRITPSLRSQKGSIWSKTHTSFDWWEIEIVFRVTGRGRVGADGLAFWYTEQRGIEGPVFGSSDKWNGLGLFFDSFDNDNKHNNPYIMVMVNDGNKEYDHHNDGATQQIAGCLRDFRNKPFPVRAKIQYYKNILSVMFNNGMSNNDNDYEMCLRAENVFLPTRGHFGLSAATGGLADDHDVQKFMTWSIIAQPDGFVPSSEHQIPSAEQQKFEKEFENYQQQLDKKKEEYIKEHPDAKGKDEEEWFEEEQIRELRQIFQGQSDLRMLVQTLSKKLDEIVGRQEATISLVSSIQQSGGLAQPQGGVPVQSGGIPQNQIQRHEVESLLVSSRELVASTREIKNLFSSFATKQDQINGRPASYGTVDYTASFNEIRDGMNAMKRDVNIVSQRVLTQPPVVQQPPVQLPNCPEITCVTTTMFIIMGVVQIALLLVYVIYQSRQEKQHKKFY